MLEFFRDPIWQFVGVLFGAVAIVIALIAPRLQRQKKLLVCQILSSVPLVISNKEEAKQRIEILFNHIPAPTVELLILKFVNLGDLPIDIGDFRDDVGVQVENAEILTAEIIESEPDSLNPSIRVETAKLFFAPIVLNSGDYFIVKVFLNASNYSTEVIGRIFGGDIEIYAVEYQASKFRERVAIVIGLGIGLVLAVGVQTFSLGPAFVKPSPSLSLQFLMSPGVRTILSILAVIGCPFLARSIAVIPDEYHSVSPMIGQRIRPAQPKKKAKP